MKQQMVHHATVDDLTHLFNRRAFLDIATSKILNHPDEAISAIILDVDHFKKINDTYGHKAGDDVLASIGQRLKNADGVAGRLGGEEFCLIVSAESNKSWEIGSRLCESIRDMRVSQEAGSISVTCSAGVAFRAANESLMQLLGRADKALYRAKTLGRDRVVMAERLERTAASAKS